MPLILGANSVSGYTVKNSLRFNSGSSDYLSKTPASNGNRQTWTWSAWIKISKLATSASPQYLFTATDNATATAGIYYGAYENQTLTFENSQISLNLRASANLFRDVSAWYHIVAVLDTTQATSTNRAKLYVNNTLITTYTSLSNYPTQNSNGTINSSGFLHTLSSYYGSSNFFDGYMADTYFIDGQALTPSSFGETDTATGIWIPKAYTGTYGTNGFYLQFKNSASLGTDSSGNGNNFTVNNLTSVDQTTDTPTNNFCTLNPLTRASQIVSGVNDLIFTEGNLVGSCDATTNRIGAGTFGVNTGKWYFEAKAGTGVGSGTGDAIGWYPNAVNSERGYRSSGDKMYDGVTQTAYGATWSAGDIIGCAFDISGGTMTFYKNGTSQGTAFTGITTNDVWLPICYARNNSMQMNFGSPMYSANGYTDGAGYGNFSYSVPSGYYSLNTKNLANYG